MNYSQVDGLIDSIMIGMEEIMNNPKRAEFLATLAWIDNAVWNVVEAHYEDPDTSESDSDIEPPSSPA